MRKKIEWNHWTWTIVFCSRAKLNRTMTQLISQQHKIEIIQAHRSVYLSSLSHRTSMVKRDCHCWRSLWSQATSQVDRWVLHGRPREHTRRYCCPSSPPDKLVNWLCNSLWSRQSGEREFNYKLKSSNTMATLYECLSRCRCVFARSHGLDWWSLLSLFSLKGSRLDCCVE